MGTVDKLNDAIRTLRDEYSNHLDCPYCPIDQNGYCMLQDAKHPDEWEEIKEKGDTDD